MFSRLKKLDGLLEKPFQNVAKKLYKLGGRANQAGNIFAEAPASIRILAAQKLHKIRNSIFKSPADDRVQAVYQAHRWGGGFTFTVPAPKHCKGKMY